MFYILVYLNGENQPPQVLKQTFHSYETAYAYMSRFMTREGGYVTGSGRRIAPSKVEIVERIMTHMPAKPQTLERPIV